jgi:hypothetical protein
MPRYIINFCSNKPAPMLPELCLCGVKATTPEEAISIAARSNIPRSAVTTVVVERTGEIAWQNAANVSAVSAERIIRAHDEAFGENEELAAALRAAVLPAISEEEAAILIHPFGFTGAEEDFELCERRPELEAVAILIDEHTGC